MTALSPQTELDSGHRTREVERLCVVTRMVRPATDMIRFVVGPDGEAVPDLKNKLPGRGIWVTASRNALGEAVKKRAFARGFKRDVRVPADLVERTEALLERAVCDALAMAGKAGLVLTGFAKVEAALERDRMVAVLHASDAAPDGVRKLEAARRRGQNSPVGVVNVLSTAQLDLALGQPNVVHAGLLAGPVSDTFLARCQRLERFRTGDWGEQDSRAAPN
jgi:uncharacterized protein